MNILSERVVWQGSSWQFQVETAMLPNQTTIERGKIVHPGAVVLVPLLQMEPDLQILMIRQYRHVLRETILELPAGTRGWDEPWLDCAQRELQEETGYRAAAFTELGDVWPAPGVSSESMRIYLAEGLHPDPLPADADEEIEVVPMLLDDCFEMAQNGRIRDAKTIIGVWKTMIHLQRQAR